MSLLSLSQDSTVAGPSNLSPVAETRNASDQFFFCSFFLAMVTMWVGGWVGECEDEAWKESDRRVENSSQSAPFLSPNYSEGT